MSDRYTALGMPEPDLQTMCPAQCEGTGWVPVFKNDKKEPWRTLWLAAEKERTSDDGWHFVKCPTCRGTGKLQERTPGVV